MRQYGYNGDARGLKEPYKPIQPTTPANKRLPRDPKDARPFPQEEI